MTLNKLLKPNLIATILLCTAFKSTSNAQDKNISFPQEIVFHAPGQNPEGITFNAKQMFSI